MEKNSILDAVILSEVQIF